MQNVRGQEAADSSRVLWLNEDRAEDVMEILNAFDLLITDYSSIYIDFC